MKLAKSAIFEIQWLPPISFFRSACFFSKIYLEIHENYQKRSFRNRCEIAGPHGRQTLSIPLQKGKNQQMPVTKVRISYHRPWQKEMWRAIKSAYSRSPYFEFYEKEFQAVFFQHYQYLYDLDKALLLKILDWLSLDVTIGETTDFCTAENAVVLSGQIRPGSNQLFRVEDFPAYTQVFSRENSFLPDLSIIDLVFNKGPESILYLQSLPQPKLPGQ